jgi:signal peptidase I
MVQDEASGETPRRNPIIAFGAWIMPAMLAVVVILPLRSAVADWNDVPSGSMWPTILEGDRIFVDKLAYGIRLPFSTWWLSEGDAPERGDIITFASPKDGSRLVKRIVGVPGDRISMTDNQLAVNGAALDYDVIDQLSVDGLQDGRTLTMRVAVEGLPGHDHEVAFTEGMFTRTTFAEQTVPEDHYFFLGDNRDQSFDSRYMGMVERTQIYGRVTHIALSVDPERNYLPRFDRWFTPVH